MKLFYFTIICFLIWNNSNAQRKEVKMATLYKPTRQVDSLIQVAFKADPHNSLFYMLETFQIRGLIRLSINSLITKTKAPNLPYNTLIDSDELGYYQISGQTVFIIDKETRIRFFSKTKSIKKFEFIIKDKTKGFSSTDMLNMFLADYTYEQGQFKEFKLISY